MIILNYKQLFDNVFLFIFIKCEDYYYRTSIGVSISNELSSNGVTMESSNCYLYFHGFRGTNFSTNFIGKNDSIMIKVKKYKIFASK